MDIKSVQLEALGYLYVTHSLKHGAFESVFRPLFAKFKKYEIFNDRDLKMKLKVNTFGDDNYDQIENFVEYEKYLHRSYFAAVQRTVNH